MNRGMERTGRHVRLLQPGSTIRLRVPNWLPGLTLAVLLGYLLSELAADVWAREELAFDQSLMEALHRLASPWLTTVILLITHSASSVVTVALVLGLVIRWQRHSERRPDTITLVVTLAGSAALGTALKALFARPRPQVFPWLTGAGGWSFPSGHALNAVVLGGLLVWLIGWRLNGWRRVGLGVLAGLWAALIGLSRVYLGVHYPSDVLASLAVGGLCLLVALYGHRMCVSQLATGQRV